MKAALPLNERQRLQALWDYRILDTKTEPAFDDLVTLASQISGCEIALISLVDECRQWFKAVAGLSGAARETPREHGFCQFAILESEPLVVEDASLDARFADSPLVTGPPFIRFYAGVPLIDEQGYALGTLCVIARRPREISQEQLDGLQRLAGQVVNNLVLHRKLQEERHTKQTLHTLSERQQDLLTITRQQAEQLQVINGRLQAILRDSSIAIGLSNFEGQLIMANPALASLFGESALRLNGKSLQDFLYQPTQEQAAALSGCLPVSGLEVQIKTNAGSPHWIRVTRSQLSESSGQEPMFLVLIEDIHGRKIAAQSLLAEKQRAEEASQAKADFLSTMSHEIRTPLNAVIGATNLLLEEAWPTEQQQLLYSLKFSAGKLFSLVNDILDYSKIAAGKIMLEHIPIHLREYAQHLYDTQASFPAEKNLAFVLDLDPALPATVLGDPIRLTQILHNLLNNAFKFTQVGEVRLRIAVAPQQRQESAQSVTIRFSVSDTGIGIPRALHQPMFEAFRQADSSATRKYGGTGLGLAITRHLVRVMGGQMGLESELGQGTTFWVDLPLAMAEAVPTASKDRPSLDGARILMAEDNEINAMIMARYLSRWKADSVHVTDGQQAVEAVKTAAFDLVLMDLHMPTLNGDEATRQILALQPDLPVILVTASTRYESREVFEEAGFREYVGKPFHPDDLFQKIQQHLPAALRQRS